MRRFSENVRAIFLVDGIGAFITAFVLFFILRTFSRYVGIPASVLTYLSAIAAFFSLYSVACYFLVKENWRRFLTFIGVANVLYCVLTFGLVIYYRNLVTALGIAYFFGEIAVILLLVYVEMTLIKKGDQF